MANRVSKRNVFGNLFQDISGVMSNLCNYLVLPQPIVMYQQDVRAPIPFVRGWMHMFWGVRSQQVPVYVHTLSAQLWFYFLFAIIAEKVD